MSGNTTELALKTAVDADDTADYLTLSLASSLTTLDALFNNTTGHSHSGAHQGGPVTAIGADAIPDGSITSAKIADGTITSADIADGGIATIDIAANAVQQQLGSYYTGTNFATTTVAVWLPTPIAVSITTAGGLLRIEYLTALYHTVPGSTFYLAIGWDGLPTQPMGVGASCLSNVPVMFSGTLYYPLPAGAHSVQVFVQNGGPGTLSMFFQTESALFITEQKR